MKKINLSFFCCLAMLSAVIQLAGVILDNKISGMTDLGGKPSAVSECNKGNLDACRELKTELIKNHFSEDPEVDKVIKKIITEWEPKGSEVMSKHTPGPWTTRRSDTLQVVRTPTGVQIADCRKMWEYRLTQDEACANATLIAAPEELRNALAL